MFFSIVIANYNGGKFIEAAICSVLAQDCRDFELIIVDGGSSDNSVEIIKSYEKRLAWWVSEKDSGQSNAFNKGFSRANGKYLTWLNSDDLMLPGTLRAVKEKLEANVGIAWATGNMIRFYDESGRVCEASWGPHYVPCAIQRNGFPLCIYGPTSFFSREAYNKVGPLDEGLHFTMDYDYWRRMIMHGYKYVRVNHTCWAFRMHEGSKTAEFGAHKRSEARKKSMLEEREISERNSGYYETQLGWIVKQLIRAADFSMVVYLFRRMFLVGREISSVYKIDKR